MFGMIARWLVTALTIIAVPYLVEGVEVDSFGAALACALVLSFLNFIVRPILVFLTFPFMLLSLGVFLLVINAVLFYWASSLVAGIHVASFGTAFVASLIVSAVSWIAQLSSKSRGVVLRNEPQRRVVDLN